MQYLNKEKWILDESGIYKLVEKAAESTFTDEQQDGLFQIEDYSWWFIYRASVIVGLMDRYYDRGVAVVDIGGGNGYTPSVAMKAGFMCDLIEPSAEACVNAKKRGLKQINCGMLTDESIIDGSIKQAMLLDVLEHIEDDNGFLSVIYKKLAPDGKIIITVPAFKCLWSSEDDDAGHFRRYKIKDLSQLAEKNGFIVEYKNYFMSFLFLPILFVRVFLEKIGVLKKSQERSEEEKQKITDSQFKSQSAIVNGVLNLLEGFEKSLLKKSGRVPFGSSVIIVLKRIG